MTDWNKLEKERVINDKIGSVPVVIVLAGDSTSFFAFERPTEDEIFSIQNDTLFTNKASYDFSGRNLTPNSSPLRRMMAYQEFWHSWRTFHPNTTVYE
jgi:hypothetical protein